MADNNVVSRLKPMIETVEGMRSVIFAQTRQIDECLHLLVLDRDGNQPLPRGEQAVFKVITTMIHMVGISGHSLLKLTDELTLGVKDAYPVARSIVEGVINICFIMAGGAEVAERAARHLEVKAYRDLKREWEVAGNRMTVGSTVKLPQAEVERLDAMLPEFTTRRGAEKDWTDESLKQRLMCIADSFSNSTIISLNASAFNIYRHASEVIHGRYYSACYFWGVTIPGRPAPSSKDEFMMILADHQFSVLVSAVFAYVGLLECFSEYTNMPEISAKVRSEFNTITKFPAIAEALES